VAEEELDIDLAGPLFDGPGGEGVMEPVTLLNRYAYVWNNPMLYVDPYGLFGLGDLNPVDDIVEGASDLAGGVADLGEAAYEAAGVYVFARPQAKTWTLAEASAYCRRLALSHYENFTAAGLGGSPIVNIHLWYDRPVMDFPFAAFVDSEVQWIFNRSKMCPEPSGGAGQHLDVSLSGARRYIDQPNAAPARRFVCELERLLPRARHARLEGWLVVKQREATFAAAPGSARHRLPSNTPVANLFLAGDWTDTGWPSTVESAVRSGLACAREVLRTRPQADMSRTSRSRGDGW